MVSEYDEALERATRVIFATEEGYLDDDVLFDYAALLHDFGVIVPEGLSRSTWQYQNGVLQSTDGFNLIGALGILAVTSLLVLGVRESAQVQRMKKFMNFIGESLPGTDADTRAGVLERPVALAAGKGHCRCGAQ